MFNLQIGMNNVYATYVRQNTWNELCLRTIDQEINYPHISLELGVDNALNLFSKFHAILAFSLFLCGFTHTEILYV